MEDQKQDQSQAAAPKEIKIGVNQMGPFVAVKFSEPAKEMTLAGLQAIKLGHALINLGRKANKQTGRRGGLPYK